MEDLVKIEDFEQENDDFVQDELLTIEELAEKLSIGRSLMYQFLKNQHIPASGARKNPGARDSRLFSLGFVRREWTNSRLQAELSDLSQETKDIITFQVNKVLEEQQQWIKKQLVVFKNSVKTALLDTIIMEHEDLEHTVDVFKDKVADIYYDTLNFAQGVLSNEAMWKLLTLLAGEYHISANKLEHFKRMAEASCEARIQAFDAEVITNARKLIHDYRRKKRTSESMADDVVDGSTEAFAEDMNNYRERLSKLFDKNTNLIDFTMKRQELLA